MPVNWLVGRNHCGRCGKNSVNYFDGKDFGDLN